jgi:hypothetical protein
VWITGSESMDMTSNAITAMARRAIRGFLLKLLHVAAWNSIGIECWKKPWILLLGTTEATSAPTLLVDEE